MKFPWNRHFYMLSQPTKSAQPRPQVACKRSRKSKPRCRSAEVVKLAMVYDGDLTMKSPWNPHKIPMKSHLSEVVNAMGDLMMGISWDLNGDFWCGFEWHEELEFHLRVGIYWGKKPSGGYIVVFLYDAHSAIYVYIYIYIYYMYVL